MEEAASPQVAQQPQQQQQQQQQQPSGRVASAGTMPSSTVTARTMLLATPPLRARRCVSETSAHLRGVTAAASLLSQQQQHQPHTKDGVLILSEGIDDDADDELAAADPLAAAFEPEHADLDLPPFRMHATRVPDRLSASFSNLSSTNYGSLSAGHHGHHHSFVMGSTSSASSRRRSLSDQLAGTLASSNTNTPLSNTGSAAGSSTNTPRSRSKSPSWKDNSNNNNNRQTLDHKLSNSFSSLEDFGVDPDILTDRLGLVELDATQNPFCKEALHASMSSLPPVSERMCEDTMDDVHAFSDITSMTRTSVTSGSSLSRGNSVATGEVGSFVLEPLDEECEYEEELDDVADDDKQQEIILTNLENLTIHETDEGSVDPNEDEDEEEDDNNMKAMATAKETTL